MSAITPEYVMEYINKHDKLIESLKERIVVLETHKLLLTERNEHLVFRMAAAEQRVSDLSNTMMNHFAYKKPVKEPFVPPATIPTACSVQAPVVSPIQFGVDKGQKLQPFQYNFNSETTPPKSSF
jgi:hypothetical protein